MSKLLSVVRRVVAGALFISTTSLTLSPASLADEFSTNTNNQPTDGSNPSPVKDYYAPKLQSDITPAEAKAIMASTPSDACGLTRKMSLLLNQHINDDTHPDYHSMAVFMCTGQSIVSKMQMLPVQSGSHAATAIETWMGLYQAMTRVVAHNSGINVEAIRKALDAANQNCILCGATTGGPLTTEKLESGLEKWLDNPPNGNADSNAMLLGQFLTGHGADFQPHTDVKNDPILKGFIESAAGEQVRKQFAQMKNPAKTNSLSFGTFDAFNKTILWPAHTIPGTNSVSGTMAGVDVPPLVDITNPLNPALQVGGFGNPPKSIGWAKAVGTRVDGNGNVNPNGKNVRFDIMNLAGSHSFFLHQVDDRPVGSSGPLRTIVQEFRWIEALPKEDMMGRYNYLPPVP